MEQTWPIESFSKIGVEAEYMIVNRQDYKIMPIAEKLFETINPDGIAEKENGPVTWSNELAAHVIELKGTGPFKPSFDFGKAFSENVNLINEKLSEHDAMLLPGGAHFFMDPNKESVLWPHGQQDIYEKFNEIFNCKGHGWTNLQSVHINLPFSNNEEFTKLHSAIRLLLPLIPCLTAASPILDGAPTGWLDTRLHYYHKNCEKIPSITGQVIPEHVNSIKEYHECILNKIYKDLEPYDPEKLLMEEWVNARGAIARFDRGAIEIRIIDTQEAPCVDEAIVRLITYTLKQMVKHFDVVEISKKTKTEELHELLMSCAKDGFLAEFKTDYFKCFLPAGLKPSLREFWIYWNNFIYHSPKDKANLEIMEKVIIHGPLGRRILKKISKGVTCVEICKQLAECLQNNRVFL